MALTFPLLLLAQKGVDTSILDSQTSDLSVCCYQARVDFTLYILSVVLLGVSRELRLPLGNVGCVIASSLKGVVDHLLQSPLQDVPPEPLEGLRGDEGSGHEASIDDVSEDPDGGLGDGPRLLQLSEHSPQESLVVISEAADG